PMERNEVPPGSKQAGRFVPLYPADEPVIRPVAPIGRETAQAKGSGATESVLIQIMEPARGKKIQCDRAVQKSRRMQATMRATP
ncbi:hypothetical protein, partial [Azoarcus sp. TTM-91]|uniref:hypothetical protein n=1 Tax=Azoarcus sp. TTM-91 TaxID=2691581 RepID=UPI001B7CDEB6